MVRRADCSSGLGQRWCVSTRDFACCLSSCPNHLANPFSSASSRHGYLGALSSTKPTRNHVTWATDCANVINRLKTDTCEKQIVGGREQLMAKLPGHGLSGGAQPLRCLMRRRRCSVYGSAFATCNYQELIVSFSVIARLTASPNRSTSLAPRTQCPALHGDEFITRLLS